MERLMYSTQEAGVLREYQPNEKGVSFLISVVRYKAVRATHLSVRNEIRSIRKEIIDPIPVKIPGDPNHEINNNLILKWIEQHTQRGITDE